MLNPWNALTTLAVQAAESAEDVADTASEAVAEGIDAAGKVAASAPATGESTLDLILLLLLILGILIVPLVLGGFIAKSLKLKDYGGRIGASLLALTLALAPLVYNSFNDISLTEAVRLGIDLAGGTNLVFEVKPTDEKEITPAVMDKMVGAVAKRINPSGQEEITVRQVGANRIEVIVPGTDPQAVNEIKRRITRLGTLEFYITANPQEDSRVIQQARALPNETKKVVDGDSVTAMWLPAYETADGFKRLDRNDAIRRPVKLSRFDDKGNEEFYDSEEYLVLVDPPNERVSGKFLTNAGVSSDPTNGSMIVTFRFNQEGAFRFGNLTDEYKPRAGRPDRALAIVLDGRLYSAPNIRDRISGNGQISGDFSREEADQLAAVLNAGALEVPINQKPLSEATVDPTLGEDVRNKGIQAILIAAAAVVGFMLLYYRAAGIIAIVCLVMNLVLVLSTMILIEATFTLPGLAGLVLTIGMAVDANVLIFERIREEQRRGASLRMSIRNGFNKAFSTIIDANLTTLLTAVVLFWIGTDQVKGFAVTLFIGIVMSMFTALFVGRTIFEIAEQKRWIKKLSMFSLVGETSWNFVGKRGIAALLSVLLIVGGLAAFSSRGSENYDIDFTGGTMVTFQLEEPAETEAVRTLLTSQFTDNFTVERLTLAGEDAAGGGRHFRLRTPENDSEQNAEEQLSAEERVSQKVNAAFADSTEMKLRKVTMDYGDLSEITVADDDDSDEAARLRRFNGGQSIEVTFRDQSGDSAEVAVGTITDNLQDAFQGISEEASERYAELPSLISIEGIEGSGLDAGARSVRTYSKIRLQTMKQVQPDDIQTALGSMQSQLASSPLFDEVNTFASAIASEMKQSAIMAIIVSLIAIVGYIWFRFQHITFGFAAVVALLHDVLIVLGLVALASWLSGNPAGQALMLNDFRINLPMVAAFLTIVGYSLNDTIVVFDRIREVRGKNPELTAEIVNTSLNQTLSRTLLTSLTTFIVVMILYVIGGEGIHGFAFCLTLGVLVGTYSSVYVASPVLIWLMRRNKTTA